MAKVGPTANLPGKARRSGRSGTVLQDGNTLGECIAIEWNVTVQQIAVVIAGTWRTDTKPGAEERNGTFRVQDVDDRWSLMVWRYCRARKNGDRAASAAMPQFNLITKLDDVGAPQATQWQLTGCQLFEYSGGHSQEDDILIREIPFTFDDDQPVSAFEYTTGGEAGTSQIKVWDGSTY